MTETAKRVVRLEEGADFRDIGGSIHRLIHPATVGPTNIGLSICSLDPGEEVVLHRHDSEEAYFVIRGEGVMYPEGHREIRLRPNIAVRIRSNAIQGHRNAGEEPLVLVAALSPPLATKPELVDGPTYGA